ncbi:MAG: nucleotidyltransferase family protein, partial [Pseudomonadota bacterium]
MKETQIATPESGAPRALSQEELFGLLCQICSKRAEREALDKLTTDDWARLWAQSIRHKVGPVVSCALQYMGVEFHPSIAAEVKAHNHQNLMRAMHHCAELARLTKLFNNNDIRFLAFKGIALLGLLKRDLNQRQCGDIDLLIIEHESIVKADKLLCAAGYEKIHEPDRAALANRKLLKFFSIKDIVYRHTVTNTVLELHFSLFNIDLLPLSNSHFFENRSQIRLGGTAIPVMSREDHLLYLLLHGSVSRWIRLKWV